MRVKEAWILGFAFGISLCGTMPARAAEGHKEEHSHGAALSVVTEDETLKEQIVKVTEGLEQIHQEMAIRRRAIQTETDEMKKAALYGELDGLRKEHDLMERLLHELVDEATATEWTAIDEALSRVKAIERYQEREYRREEVIRDRQS